MSEAAVELRRTLHILVLTVSNSASVYPTLLIVAGLSEETLWECWNEIFYNPDALLDGQSS